jgi:hypothetical protein
MTAYTSIYNTPPSGSNYLIGDTVTLTGGDVWKYAGNGQWVAALGGVANQIVAIGVPFCILPGDGSTTGLQFTGSAGAFTLSAAILTNVWNALKGCWCYMPSGFGGSGYAAGWYWAVFSSDTAGVLYSDTYVSGRPVRDFSPTAFPVNLNGWLTQTTSAVTGPTGFTLAGGSLGRNGSLRTYLRATGNTIGTKTFRAYLGSVAIFGATPVPAPTIDYCMSVVNLASETLQTGAPVNAPIGIGSALSSFAAGNCITVDTTVDQVFSMSLQISANTASAILLNASVTVTYGA